MLLQFISFEIETKNVVLCLYKVIINWIFKHLIIDLFSKPVELHF